MNKSIPSHDNTTPEMKAANHAICTLASVMRDCEHCPFKPVQPAKATKPAFGNISGIIHPAHLRVIQPLGGSRPQQESEQTMNTNEYGVTIEHIRQNEVNDIFKATYQGKEAFYTFPRSMEMKAEDVHDFVKPEDFRE